MRSRRSFRISRKSVYLNGPTTTAQSIPPDGSNLWKQHLNQKVHPWSNTFHNLTTVSDNLISGKEQGELSSWSIGIVLGKQINPQRGRAIAERPKYKLYRARKWVTEHRSKALCSLGQLLAFGSHCSDAENIDFKKERPILSFWQ